MLSTIVTAVIAQLPGGVVAGRVAGAGELEAGIRSTGSDVVVMQHDTPGDPAGFVPLLRQFPELRVVAITADGHSGYLHELRPSQIHLAELSATALDVALRAAAG